MVMTARPTTNCNPYSDWTMTTTNVPPTGAPAITSHPSNVTITATGTATFTVVATTPAGSGTLAYQWYQGGNSGGTLLPGEISSTYSMTSVSEAYNGMQYAVRVSNNYSSVWSNNATLTVGTTQTPTAPTILQNPANAINYNKLINSSFTVVASGYPYPSFLWQEQIGGVWASADPNEPGLIGWDTSNLSVARASLVTGRTFRVVVYNSVGTATSTAATLTVVTAPSTVTHDVVCPTGSIGLTQLNYANVTVLATGITQKRPTTFSAAQTSGTSGLVGWLISNTTPNCYDVLGAASEGNMGITLMPPSGGRAGNSTATFTVTGWSAYTFTVAPTLKVVIPRVQLKNGAQPNGAPVTPSASIELYVAGALITSTAVTATESPQVVSLTGVPTVSTTTTEVKFVIVGKADNSTLGTSIDDYFTVSDIYLEG